MRIWFDTETTGLGPFGKPPREDACLSVGLAFRTPAALPEHRAGDVVVLERFVRPEPRFLENGYADIALRINKITPEQLATAPYAHEVADWLRGVLGWITSFHHPAGVTFNTYNRPFDQHFLDPLLTPSLVAGIPWWTWECSAEEARGRAQQAGLVAGNQWLSLKKASELWGLPENTAAHSAGADAKQALLLWEAMKVRPPARPVSALP